MSNNIRQVPRRARAVTLEDIVTAYNREVLPLLEELYGYAALPRVQTTRLTGSATLRDGDDNVFCNTDSGALTVTLPPGLDGKRVRIINTGSSGSNVTVTPATGENLLGASGSQTLLDGDVLVLTFEEQEGWW